MVALRLLLGGLIGWIASSREGEKENEIIPDYDEISGDDAIYAPDFLYPIEPTSNILFLQTIDGKLHAVNRENGKAMWGEKTVQLTKNWFPQVGQLARKTSRFSLHIFKCI